MWWRRRHKQHKQQEIIKFVPGDNIVEKREWCADRMTEALELIDNLVPIVGFMMDNPVMDALEKQAIRLFVSWVFKKVFKV